MICPEPVTELIKVDRVVCDEVLTVQEVEQAVPVPLPLPPGSAIDPNGTRIVVTVTECDLAMEAGANRFTIDLTLFFKKRILISRPGAPALPLEFSFARKFPGLPVKGCCPGRLPPDVLRRLRCQVFDLQAEETLWLDIVGNTFSETLTVTVAVKLVFEDQIPLPAPPAPPPPVVDGELEIVAGKIRARIGDPVLKARLLAELARAQELLAQGRILDALAVLSGIADELFLAKNLTPARSVAIDLVLSDLQRARKEILGFL